MNGYPTRFVNAASARLRFGDRVDRIGLFLSRVDEPADRVVLAIEELPKGEGFGLFERGLRGGARVIPGAPLAMRELLESAEDVPAWVDWEACDRGGAMLMRSGVLGGAVLGARSLPQGYASPGGNKPLVFSGRLTENAARRVNETARFVQAVSRPGGMRPFADGWQITLKVRLMHAQVRRFILKSGRWNEGAWGAPINQHDMAGTTLLFSMSIIDGLRQLGMHIGSEEAESYIHLWRWAGRVIGVDERVLPASESEATRIAEVIAATMGEPDDDSRALTTALFSSAIAGARTPERLRRAAREVSVGATVCRELLGDDLADKLSVPRSKLRFVMPTLKRIVRSIDRFTLAVPFAERSAVAAGMRYWDRVVEVGLGGATAEFGLPERLSAAA